MRSFPTGYGGQQRLRPHPQTSGRDRRKRLSAIAMPQRLEELFGIIISMAREIRDPFEQAFFVMVDLPYLQPFEDVNKRVSRLAANIPFIRHNLCPLSFIDVPERAYIDAMLGVYERTVSNFCETFLSGPMSVHASSILPCDVNWCRRTPSACVTDRRSAKR